MSKINLKKDNGTIQQNTEEYIEEYVSKENIFNKLRHKIFGYREGEVEEIKKGVYRIYPTIEPAEDMKKEMRKDIIICITANIIITLIVNGVFYLLGIYP